MPIGSNPFKHFPPTEFGAFLGVIESPKFRFRSFQLRDYALAYPFQQTLMDVNWDSIDSFGILCTEGDDELKNWYQHRERARSMSASKRQRLLDNQSSYDSKVANASSRTLALYVYSEYDVFVSKSFKYSMRPVMHAVFLRDKFEEAIWININTWQDEIELYRVLRRGRLG